jgi:hypothetical protein
VIVWMVPKVGMFLLCYEDSGCCGGGGGNALGSVFGWIVRVLVVGYVICSGGGGYVMVGCVEWFWLVAEV